MQNIQSKRYSYAILIVLRFWAYTCRTWVLFWCPSSTSHHDLLRTFIIYLDASIVNFLVLLTVQLKYFQMSKWAKIISKWRAKWIKVFCWSLSLLLKKCFISQFHMALLALREAGATNSESWCNANMQSNLQPHNLSLSETLGTSFRKKEISHVKPLQVSRGDVCPSFLYVLIFVYK